MYSHDKIRGNRTDTALRIHESPRRIPAQMLMKFVRSDVLLVRFSRAVHPSGIRVIEKITGIELAAGSFRNEHHIRPKWWRVQWTPGFQSECSRENRALGLATSPAEDNHRGNTQGWRNMARSTVIVITLMFATAALLTDEAIKSDAESGHAVQEKVRSFSCARGGAGGDVQLAWTDDQPYPDKVMFTEGKFGIYLRVSPPPELPQKNAAVTVGTSPKLTISVDGQSLAVHRVWVTDPTARQRNYRDASAEELTLLSKGIKRYLAPCFHNTYEFIGLDDEL